MSEQPLWYWFTEQVDPFESHSFAVSAVHYFGRTQIQAAQIIETVGYGKMLVIDGRIQSTQEDEAIYHEALVHPAMIAHDAPHDVLIIGGGEGATLREVLRHRTVTRAVMVDIDGELVELCQKHLPEWHQGAFADARAEVVIGDGWDYVSRPGPAFDVIIMDVCDALVEGPALRLYTEEFFNRLRGRLKPGGILALQAMELSTVEFEDHRTVRRALGPIFRTVRSYATHVPTFWANWGYIIASDALDPAALGPEAIDRRLAERALDGRPSLVAQGEFYDGQTHVGMFALPLSLRRLLEDSPQVDAS